MTEKLGKAVEKLEDAASKAVDYVVEHPVKTLVIGFVVCKLIKWLKE